MFTQRKRLRNTGFLPCPDGSPRRCTASGIVIEAADPFIGTDVTDLPPSTGLSATWWWPKPQVGNTHPGATSPLGMVSACAYSGAYPTGYGVHDLATEGIPSTLHDRLMVSGFTHFQQSGTGAIHKYYNYLRVTPMIDPLVRRDVRDCAGREDARQRRLGHHDRDRRDSRGDRRPRPRRSGGRPDEHRTGARRRDPANIAGTAYFARRCGTRARMQFDRVNVFDRLFARLDPTIAAA